MSVVDTTAPAQAQQLEAQRALSSEQRLQTAFEMSLFARELAKAGIRRDHPEWSEARIATELIRRAFLPGQPPVGFR